ncbi:MAG: hypothetical protein K6G19_09040, partial [Lachnospiraceae bacterium]|nr:hypothetical protein [Lachnospiraceae bacterium]
LNSFTSFHSNCGRNPPIVVTISTFFILPLIFLSHSIPGKKLAFIHKRFPLYAMQSIASAKRGILPPPA